MYNIDIAKNINKKDIGFFAIPFFNATVSFIKIILITMFFIDRSNIAQIENINLIMETVSFALISPLFSIFKEKNKNLNASIFIKSTLFFSIFSLIIIFSMKQIENLLNISNLTTFLRIAVVGMIFSFILTFLQVLVSVNIPEKLFGLAFIKVLISVTAMLTLYPIFKDYGVLYAEIFINFLCIVIYLTICYKKDLLDFKNVKNIKTNLASNSIYTLIQTVIDTVALVFFLKAYVNKIGFAGDFWFMEHAITMAYFLIINGFCEKIKSTQTNRVSKTLIINTFKVIIFITILMPVWINVGYLLGLEKDNTGLFILFSFMSIPKMITSIFYSWFISVGEQKYTIISSIINIFVHIAIFSYLNLNNMLLNYSHFLFVYGVLMMGRMVGMIISYIVCTKDKI